jgi:hypothetical protein
MWGLTKVWSWFVSAVAWQTHNALWEVLLTSKPVACSQTTRSDATINITVFAN